MIKKETKYSILDNGDIYSHKFDIIMKKHIDRCGYELIRLNSQKWLLVHRLVAKAFIPNPLNKPQVNHKDLNKKNNAVSNLEWVTHQENMTHAKNNGVLIGKKKTAKQCLERGLINGN